MKTSTDIERVYGDGEVIFREGDPGREMFIVDQGRVRITKTSGGQEHTLDIVERGDFFGDMSLLESLPRFADATAIGETRLLVIEPGGLLLRIRRDPSLAVEMLHALSSRLRIANTKLVELLGEDGKPGISG